MGTETYQKLTGEALRLLAAYHKGGVSASECAGCSSACCSHGGLAVLENVLLIYDLYREGALKREDYEYPAGLSFRDFVGMYFDLEYHTMGWWLWKRDVLVFHLRSLSPENRVIAIPGVGHYYETRSELFRENPWMNRGCVFLSKKVPNWPEDDKDGSRRCILHRAESATHLTAKPIDCVFYTCQKPFKAKTPTVKESRRWFRRVLAVISPRSLERYRALVEKDGAPPHAAAADSPSR